MDTIFALSSGHGRAGVAVIRLSGPATRFAIETLTGVRSESDRSPFQTPRHLHLLPVQAADGTLIDRALVVAFPGPRSFTGEDCVEIHGHGSVAVVEAILDTLGRLPGLRMAQAGEFAQRAFLNGKMDLVAADGLADLINAETELQRRAALRQSDGVLSTLYADWRTQLIDCAALVMASIDFSDEGDVPDDLVQDIVSRVSMIKAEIDRHIDDSDRSIRLRDGLTAAIVGPPNAGKSSLINWLANRDVAIVSAEAGTTRDRLDARVILAGVPVTFVDTAGLRRADNKIEAEGVRRAEAALAEADLVLAVTSPDTADSTLRSFLDLSDKNQIWIHIRNKIDLSEAEIDLGGAELENHKVSVKTGAGLDSLADHIADQVTCLAGVTENAAATRSRYLAELRDVSDALAGVRADRLYETPEVVAEELRRACDSIGRITGAVHVEDILGAVFSTFCVGK